MHGTSIKTVVFFCLKYSTHCMISGFCCDIAENCALLGYYAASSGNFLPTCGTTWILDALRWDR
jgi:hypothetical protein